MTATPFDRSDYATPAGGAYLNQASLGLIGRPAVDAMHRFIDDVGRHGNLNMSDEDEAAFLDSLRSRAAALFHTDASRIAILSGASELLGQIPYLLRPPPDREVVLVTTDFPAVTRPWLRLAEHGGCRVRFVADEPGSDLTDDLVAAIDDTTWLVAVGSVQYATGSLVDVARLRAATASAGVKLVIDATQAAGAMDVDAASWDADVVVSSGYKWLGGHGGVAVAAIGPALLDEAPPLPGWMGAPDPFAFDATSLAVAPDARRFTQSTMSYVSVVGLTAALDRLLAIGLEAIESHAARLGRLLVDAVTPHGWRPLRPPGTSGAANHIVSLAHATRDAAEANTVLRSKGIVCSARGDRIRVSLAPYNDEHDVAALAGALE